MQDFPACVFISPVVVVTPQINSLGLHACIKEERFLLIVQASRVIRCATVLCFAKSLKADSQHRLMVVFPSTVRQKQNKEHWLENIHLFSFVKSMKASRTRVGAFTRYMEQEQTLT